MIQTFTKVRTVAALAAASLCLAVMSCGGPKANTLSQQEIADGWHLLYNGEDLTGWEVFGSEIWYVDEEGVLLGESGEEGGFGYLATVEYYNDFELSLDFRQITPSNSGLFFRSRIDYDSPSLIFGLECDILPLEENNTAGICEVGGRGLLTPISGEKAAVMKVGDWNTLRLKVEGEHIQTWLNGEQMVDLTDEELDVQRGHIALQVHDGGGIKVAWRNIKIKTL
ncbi:MAG: DUF1080 domain-containing protein [Bacteroidales bacterium]|nr:DUF1080 domain-containing protein [Bacteroidales bacterium]